MKTACGSPSARAFPAACRRVSLVTRRSTTSARRSRPAWRPVRSGACRSPSRRSRSWENPGREPVYRHAACRQWFSVGPSRLRHDQLDTLSVGGERRIIRKQQEWFRLRLGDEHPIEGVGVHPGQSRHGGRTAPRTASHGQRDCLNHDKRAQRALCSRPARLLLAPRDGQLSCGS